MKELDKSISSWGDGTFRAGASVRLQKLIIAINEAGYGGIEYLFSVPGTVGGAVVMNAGRGRQFNKCISDYITKVTVLKEGEIKEFNRKECCFSYRNSIFKNDTNYIILSVDFLFPAQMWEESYRLRKERIEWCKTVQDNSAPNFGTAFMEADEKIMKLARHIGIGGKRVHFSRKTTNWILNSGNGTYKDAVKAMQKVEWIHYLLRKQCKAEVVKWK